jgi:hypothetical protein
MRRARRSKVLGGILAVGTLGVLVAACGESTTTLTRNPLTRSSTTGNASSGRPSVTTGPVRATLHGQGHDPVVGQKWIYTLAVTDAQGHGLSGTIDTEFALQGTVVGHDTPPTHSLKNGHYKEALKFPPVSVGYPIDLQVVVHTKLGSVTLDWPVTVHK